MKFSLGNSTCPGSHATALPSSQLCQFATGQQLDINWRDSLGESSVKRDDRFPNSGEYHPTEPSNDSHAMALFRFRHLLLEFANIS
ncbi:hypothetical protein Baya_8642 [Bagarius yarrelli]|uniref:Uncharacterized protein n=1 Tax=Bagarius yarrelli TaxID=175774 RepID=A0A556U4I9_BAGYA|nr:hypothetical protein Baya_8642 [Bagarius yarrelli]